MMTSPYPAGRPANWPPGRVLGADFIQGFVAAGALAVVQQGTAKLQTDPRSLRIALQGGVGLAAGRAAARAWQAGNVNGMLLALLAGTGGVMVLEKLIQDHTSKENDDVQKKA